MISLVEWNALSPADARQELLVCCAAPAWAHGLVEERPFSSVGELLDASDRVLGVLGWADVRPALDAHPRIGERIRRQGTEADWSRREQAGAQGADEATARALVEANEAYEERFGHVFLIFATGRSAGEMLAAARERLNNDEITEQAVVRAELARITRLRLERLLT
ncbi:2-oxo-4-hydroxy-4-carboxy-5-ureidoimidazoline decarboxylase [Virgisporangium ochraceum]|uniref:2-oxo-4-hydroxy-4-carboxy-5-ureidoimidazoline decarboxylase n=1 Tax=Virgisporangium ochraceum TaxID=65505 RepID=UPI0019421489|nr:2-oxo-4-hydroxy-4-carboxy-5-ureidoimidazoline decarboxylase [Virgisporangium ochraceum]